MLGLIIIPIVAFILGIIWMIAKDIELEMDYLEFIKEEEEKRRKFEEQMKELRGPQYPQDLPN
jgi:hypothetical protein